MLKPKIVVGVGGTLRSGSSTEAAIRWILRDAESRGAETRLFAGEALDLPMYVPGNASKEPRAEALIAALRAADAIILGSPGYHCGISGLVKNAIDYTEEMSADAAPYFEGRAVACIATGSGWQGCNMTLAALRNVTHALRGWPTPLGIAVNTRTPVFDKEGACLSPELELQLKLVAQQLLSFSPTST